MEVILESLSVFWVAPWKDTTALLVWCIFLGASGVLVYWAIRRETTGKMLRKLTEAGCESEETAKSPEELGLKPSLFQNTDHLLQCVREEGTSPRYYIPEGKKSKAEYFLRAAAANPWKLLGGIAAMYLLMIVIYHLIPTALSFFEFLS